MNDERFRKLQIPIIIGITGHRDLRSEDIESLKITLKELFLDITKKCPDTPFILLSPLAEGADQLAAEVAMGMGIPVIAPLPMAVEEYVRDFKTKVTLNRFRSLLKQVVKYFELPLVDGNTNENTCLPGHNRNRQYAQVGAYIAHHCQILIAMWDGKIATSNCGTAAVVDYKRNGIPEPYGPSRSLMDSVEPFRLIQIKTLRAGKTDVEDSSSEKAAINDTENADIFAEIVKDIVAYNKDVSSLTPKLDSTIIRNKGYLIPPVEEENLEDREQAMLGHYATADTLAGHYKEMYSGALSALLYLMVSGIVFLQVYLKMLRSPVLLVGFVLCYVIAFVMYKRLNRLGPQKKFLDYRGLAEGLRIQLVWNVAGVRYDVSNSYLRKQKNDLDWIRFAIRSANISGRDTKEAISVSEKKEESNLRLLLDKWVKDERDFFRKRAIDFAKIYSKISLGALISFSIGILLAAGSLIIFAIKPEYKTLLNPVTGIATIALSIATALRVYSELMGFKEHSVQYRRMLKHFEKAVHDLETHINAQQFFEARRLIRDLGKESLRENGDWLLLHRSRPVAFSKILFAPK